MRLNDLKNKMLQKFFHGEKDGSRRPDGGTSCYRPIRKKSPTELQGQEEQLQQPMTYQLRTADRFRTADGLWPADGFRTARTVHRRRIRRAGKPDRLCPAARMGSRRRNRL